MGAGVGVRLVKPDSDDFSRHVRTELYSQLDRAVRPAIHDCRNRAGRPDSDWRACRHCNAQCLGDDVCGEVLESDARTVKL